MPEFAMPSDFRERFARMRMFMLDELGFGILWEEGLRSLYSEEERRLDLSRTDLNEVAREKLNSWALAEIVNGLPTKSAHSIVSYWGALEVLVEDVFVLRVQHNPSLLQGELGKTRLSIADYQLLEEDDMLRLVASQAPGVRGRTAPGSFEALLDFVGLSGPVGDRCRRDLRELEQVRNVLVHRNGVADRRLIEVAHQLEVEAGRPITLTADDALRYYRACDAYAETLQNRVEARYAGSSYPPDPVEAEPVDEDEDRAKAPQPQPPISGS